MSNAIDSFSGEYRFLSNFATSYLTARVDRRVINAPTVEHAFQALKATTSEDRIKVLSERTPGAAKKMGRAIVKRADWDEVKIKFMRTLVLAKFQQNPELAEKLLATGKAELVEGNWWGDRFWGVCRGQGENHLGRILMWVRAELRRHSPAETVVGGVADESGDESDADGATCETEVTTPLPLKSEEDSTQFSGPYAKLDQWIAETNIYSFPWQWIQHPLFRDVCALPDVCEEIIRRMEAGEVHWCFWSVLRRQLNYDPTTPDKVGAFLAIKPAEANRQWIEWYRNRDNPAWWSAKSDVASDQETSQEGGEPEGVSGATE